MIHLAHVGSVEILIGKPMSVVRHVQLAEYKRYSFQILNVPVSHLSIWRENNYHKSILVGKCNVPFQEILEGIRIISQWRRPFNLMRANWIGTRSLSDDEMSNGEQSNYEYWLFWQQHYFCASQPLISNGHIGMECHFYDALRLRSKFKIWDTNWLHRF